MAVSNSCLSFLVSAWTDSVPYAVSPKCWLGRYTIAGTTSGLVQYPRSPFVLHLTP